MYINKNSTLKKKTILNHIIILIQIYNTKIYNW